MQVLVCGGRDYNDKKKVWGTLDTLHIKTTVTFLVHGGARGADEHADNWAVSNWVPVKVYPADWEANGKFAGPLRNQQMVDDNPDIALAVAFPGGRGTADMVRRARQKGIEVMEVDKESHMIS